MGGRAGSGGRGEIELLTVLSTAGAALLWALALLLGLAMLAVITLLFVPFDFRLRWSADLAAAEWESPLQGRAEMRLRLRWGVLPLTAAATWSDGRLRWSAVRLAGLRLSSPVRRGAGKGGRRESRAGAPRRGPRAGPRRQERERGKRARRPDPKLLLALAREAVRLPGRLWRSLGVRLTAEGTYGLPDPALTGCCEALRWSTGLGRSLRLRPDFLRPCFIGSGELAGRLYLYRVAAIFWQVVRTPPIWNELVGQIRFRPLRAMLLRGGA